MTTMSYYLAVDLGTSRTAAATARIAPDGSLLAAPFPLGRNTDQAPTAVFVSDGELLFGDAAERRGVAQPDRLIREFKRRIGDDVPIVAADTRFAPEELFALTVAWVVDVVSEREGRGPAAISVTVPVTWGLHRTHLVTAALERELGPGIEVITEPEAAARHYEATNPLESGRALAVYDLGGGTFDAVILRKGDDDGVHIVGKPAGLSDFGGADFDDAVFRHVIAASGVSTADLASARMALASLRRECVDAKESLSFDSEAVVPVLIGERHATIRITRSEFEQMIEAGIERSIGVFADALDSANVDPDDIDSILLTGGSSRIPRVAQLLSERFDRPIAIDADPKAIVALGAVRAVAATRVAPRAVGALAAVVAVESADSADATDIFAVEAEPTREPRAKRSWFGRVPAVAAVGVGTLVLASGIVLSSATSLNGAPAEPEFEAASFVEWLGLDSDALATSAPIAGGVQEAPVAPAAPVAEAVPVAETQVANPRAERTRAAAAKTPERAPAAPSKAPAQSGGNSQPGSGGGNSGGSGSTGSSTEPTQPPATSVPSTPPPATAEPTTPPPTAEPTTPPATEEPTTPPPTTDPTTPPATAEPTTPPPTEEPEPTTAPEPAETIPAGEASTDPTIAP